MRNMIKCNRSLFFALLSLAPLVACSAVSVPRADRVEWSVTRTPDKKGYHLTGRATFARGLDGWYQPTVTLLDAKGCNRGTEIGETQIANRSSTGTVDATFDRVILLDGPVATATFDISYQEVTGGQVSRQSVFNEQRTLDSSVRPPVNPVDACGNIARGDTAGSRREKLREKAKTDPDGADAQAIDQMSRNELVATAINSAGYLCARVTDLYPSGNDIVAKCVEYRNGSGTVRYRVNPSASTVEPM